MHCKTNVPQGMLALDSVNNVFGRVLNPENRVEWTAGGSSGGEAALVNMRGCVFGIGTDVGGSIRIPAMCNGVVGCKPSLGRLPAGGQELGQLDAVGRVGLVASVGCIARAVRMWGFVWRLWRGRVCGRGRLGCCREGSGVERRGWKKGRRWWRALSGEME